jgi:hypothetical protein
VNEKKKYSTPKLKNYIVLNVTNKDIQTKTRTNTVKIRMRGKETTVLIRGQQGITRPRPRVTRTTTVVVIEAVQCGLRSDTEWNNAATAYCTKSGAALDVART